MGFRVLPAADAFWRPSNQLGVLNTDLAKQLGATTLGARLVRVDDELLTLQPLSALLVEPDSVRQVFNGRDADTRPERGRRRRESRRRRARSRR